MSKGGRIAGRSGCSLTLMAVRPSDDSDYRPLLRPEVRARLDARRSVPKGSSAVKVSTPQGAGAPARPEPPKSLSCPVCGRGFKYPKRLASHIAGCGL